MFSSEVETKGIRLILTLFRATREHTIKKVSTPSRRIIQRDALLHDRTLSAFGQVPVERRLARLSRMWNHRGTPPSTHPPVSFFLRSLRHVCHHGPSNVQSPTTFPQPFSPSLSLSLSLLEFSVRHSLLPRGRTLSRSKGFSFEDTELICCKNRLISIGYKPIDRIVFLSWNFPSNRTVLLLNDFDPKLFLYRIIVHNLTTMEDWHC